MKLLVMDTSCKTAMAAVCEDGSVLASIQIQDQKTHCLLYTSFLLAGRERKRRFVRRSSSSSKKYCLAPQLFCQFITESCVNQGFL